MVDLSKIQGFLTRLQDIDLKEECEKSLMALTGYLWDVLDPGEELVTGWAMDAIADHLEATFLGHILRLLITVPPGFSKSSLTNVFFPTWVWLKEPHNRFIKASYEQGIPERDNDKVRRIIAHEKFQRFWSDRFKITHPNTIDRFENDKTGWQMATAVGAKLIGHRGNYILIDDPNDPSVENQSGAKRITAVRWFRETVPTRLNNMERDKIIAIQQRLHMEDIAGTALGLEHENYVHLNIPMEYEPRLYINAYRPDPDNDEREQIETLFDDDAVQALKEDPDCVFWRDPRSREGELAWEERFPASVVKKLKKTLGRTMSEAQLQQHSVPRGGNIIKTEDWRTWDKEVYPKIDFMVAALDTAYTEDTENDPAALIIWGLWHDEFGNPKIMMIYAWSDWLEFRPLINRVLHTCTKDGQNYGDDIKHLPRYPVDALVIEGKASGLSVQQEIARHLATGYKRFLKVEMVPSKLLRDDKISRLVAVSHMFGKNDGIVYAPQLSWADAVIDQVGNFPYGTHDDYVDCTAHGLRWYRDQGFACTREELFEQEQAVRAFQSKAPPLYGSV